MVNPYPPPDPSAQYPQQPPGQQPYPQQPYPQPGYPQSGYPQPGYPQPGYPAQDPTAVVGTRVGQYILDALLVTVPLIVLFVLLGTLAAGAGSSSDVAGALFGVLMALLALVAIASWWFVQAWWPYNHGGQTPAMGWLKLRIVDYQGGLPSLGALTLRWILLVVIDGGLVGLIVMIASQRHQRLGDMVAHTVVIRAD